MPISTPGGIARKRFRMGKHKLTVVSLAVVSIIISYGFTLVYKGKARSFDEANAALTAKQIIDLNEVSNAGEIVPYLIIFENQADREFAAKKIFDYVTSGGADRSRRLPNVGSLAEIRVEESEINSNSHVDVFRKRLQEVRASGNSAERTLPLMRLTELRQIKPSFVVRNPEHFRKLLLIWISVFLATFWGVALIWRMRDFQGDGMILSVIMLLTGVGFVLMIALPDPLRDKPLFQDFALGIALGNTAMLAVSSLEIRALLRKFWIIPLVFGCIFSLVLIFFGSGPAGSDAKVNLNIPFIGTIQPVEIIKILVVLFLAGYFAQHWQFLRGTKEKRSGIFRFLQRINAPRIEYLFPVLAGTALVLFFFFLQKDNGPALVLFGLFLILYAVARNRMVFVAALPLIMVPVIWFGYSYGYVRTVGDRIQMWVYPWDNCVKGGDQLASSEWALASGGFSGAGLGLGRPSTVPAAHTDLVLSALGEETGFLGILAVLMLYTVLIYRCIRLSLRASGSYAFFLSFGLTMILALSVLLIAGGTVGLLPLSGVVFPFLSYGKTSMIANFIIVGLILALSAISTGKDQTDDFGRPVKWVMRILAVAFIGLLLKAGYTQIVRADETLIAGTLAVQSDGTRLYQYNPRLLEIARQIPRGTIYDRNGIPIATSNCQELQQYRAVYQTQGINIDEICSRLDTRYYPFGGLTFHLLGDWRTRQLWGASNTLFEERDSNVWLQGYDDHSRFEKIKDFCTKQEITVQRRDLQELIPLLRHRFDPDNQEVARILNRDRNIHMSIDIRLQRGLAIWLADHLRSINKTRGAIVVLDPQTGDVLASVSYPYPEVSQRRFIAGADQADDGSFFDRAREGLYPPGSTFKMVTALAALTTNRDLSNQSFLCRRLSDGRVGNVVDGRTIRDDVSDKQPHGTIALENGLAFSCNAYFAQLGLITGPEAICNTANALEIKVTKNNDPVELRPLLLESSYGQGQVVLTPFQMARVAATISNDGNMAYGRWVTDASNQRNKASQRIASQDVALTISRSMRKVVTEGTGKILSKSPIPLAGKTGTAQVEKQDSHSWFAGFAPYGVPSSRQIAFAIFIENGGYGGKAAAPAASEIAAQARSLGLILR
jgi:cell division protein FtsI/penicillin-binding protein 2/cell division protein FtsW (lipid II flippase)